MYTSFIAARRAPQKVFSCLAVAMGLAADVPATERLPTPPTIAAQEAAVEKSVRTVTLAECLQVALDQQPTLVAFRASRAAAETRLRAVNDLHVPECLVRDLPIRRKQATLGVVIASEAVTREERESAYFVTRLYYSAVYARQQQDTVDKALASLRQFRKDAKELRDNGFPGVNDYHLARMNVYIQLVESRREEAVVGVERATAALR